MERRHNRLYASLIYAVLALATFMAYEQVRHNDFVNYDDDKYVTKNPRVQAGLTRDSIYWAFTTNHASNWHPLTWLSHMLDCQLFETNSSWHHLTNLSLHIANALLLFVILKKMTSSLWASGFVAALFALHPLHVESVAWISERKDVLSALFWLLTMAAYLRYVKYPNISRYLLTLLLFTLGLMAKPMLVTLPFVLLLLDYWPLCRFELENTGFQKQGFRRLILEKMPFFILSAVSSVITFLVQQRAGVAKTVKVFPLDLRVTNAFISYIKYIGKMIWPSRLAVFYPHPVDRLPIWQFVVAVMVLLGISIWVICLARKYKYLPVGWFWYVGTLVPVIGLIQVGDQALADRYSYIPSIGIFVMVTWGAAELISKWHYRRIILRILAGMALAILLVCTRVQVGYWQNSFTLFEHALLVTEDNYMAHINYGASLCEDGRFDEAVTHFKRALQIDPRHLDARNNLSAAFFKQGKVKEAIANLTEILRIKPDYPEVLNNLAWVLATTEDTKLQNPIEAVKFAQRACELTEYSRPDFLDTLAVAYAAAGRFHQAIEIAEKAVKLTRTTDEKKLAQEIQNRLKLYKAGQPYRQW